MYFLFDIGGTNMRLAVSWDGKNISSPKIVPTPQNFYQGIKKIEEIAKELAHGKKVKAAAGGIAGPLNREKTRVLNAPHLKNWNRKPLKKELVKILSTKKIFIENDAAIAGLGESVGGAGIGKEIVVYFTISTGVGGARIVNRKIDDNALGFEPGHQIIDFKNSRTLEDFISGSGIKKQYGKNPEEISSQKFWDNAARILAYGLNNATIHWSPHLFILGGSIMNKINLKRVIYHFKRLKRTTPRPPAVKKSVLGDKVGVLGALALIKKN